MGEVLRKYHIYLVDGSQRTLAAWGAGSTDGALVLFDEFNNAIITYAPGTWVYSEREFYDDRGYPGDSEENPKPEPQ